MWYVGLDVHLDTTSISIRDARGQLVRRNVVPTTRAGIKGALRRVRGRARVVCESGPLAAWVRDALETRFREVIVCDRRRTRLSSSGAKTDRTDADRLSELARGTQIHVVHVPRGEGATLRRYAIHYSRMLRERSRIIQRLRSLFFECAVRVRSHRRTPERVPLSRLVLPGSREVARAYQRQLAVATELVVEAREALVSLAQCTPSFALLTTIPYVGKVRAAQIIAVAGDPSRFRSLRAFWCYAGLGVIQKVSSEHRVENGRAVREDRARGIKLKMGHPLLKKVIRDAALHASLRRRYFKDVFDAHVARGKTPAIARVALARKIAATILAVWRRGVPFVAPQRIKGSRGEHLA